MKREWNNFPAPGLISLVLIHGISDLGTWILPQPWAPPRPPCFGRVKHIGSTELEADRGNTTPLHIHTLGEVRGGWPEGTWVVGMPNSPKLVMPYPHLPHLATMD